MSDYRVRGKQAAAQTSTRRGAIVCRSPISTAPVLRPEKSREGPATAGDRDRMRVSCLYVYAWRRVGGMFRCAGSKSV